MLPKICMTSINNIASNSTNPEKAKEVMIQGMEQTFKLIKCRSVLDLMSALRKSKVGTTEA